MARVCAQCGNLLYDQSTVCAVCGTQVVTQPAQPVSFQQPVDPYSQQPGYGYPQQPVNPYPQQPGYGYPQPVVYVKQKTPGRGFGITSLVLGIIGLVYSLYYVFYIPLLGEIVSEVGTQIGDDRFTGLMETSVSVAFVIAMLMYSSLSIMALCFAPAAKKRGYCNKVQQGGLITGAIGMGCWVVGMVLALVM